jgi:hypothetical protein
VVIKRWWSSTLTYGVEHNFKIKEKRNAEKWRLESVQQEEIQIHQRMICGTFDVKFRRVDMIISVASGKAELAAIFKVPAMICINKFDLNPVERQAIEAFVEEKDLSVVGRVPFDPTFTRAMIDGKTIVEFDNTSEGGRAVTAIWENPIQRF